jgi:DNA-binding response OmpR family regulator
VARDASEFDPGVADANHAVESSSDGEEMGMRLRPPYRSEDRQVRARILVVEDDEAMALGLADRLRFEGYEAEVARDGETGLELARATRPDLMILDVLLPRMSGLDVCSTLRNDGSELPIIMLTARGRDADRVCGLKLGADDYMTKPFSFMELAARVEAVLRRCRPRATDRHTTYSFADVTVDFDRHEATKGDRRLRLTPREVRLLRFFVDNRGDVVTRDRLLEAVWGYDTIPFTRTVDTHIAKLRKKIEDDPSDPRHLITVHRVGYKFVG